MDRRLTAHVAALPAKAPFVGPEALERQLGRAFRARLGANESVFGPSPKAIEAMQRAVPEAWKYPDPDSHDLRAALADHHGIPSEAIVVGAGIDGLLGSAVRLFVAPGDAVVTSGGAYPTFSYHVRGHGGHLHNVPYRDDHEDLMGLAEAAHRTGAKLVYLANPDNPLGTVHPPEAVTAFAEALPDSALLILDEAYVECDPALETPPLVASEARMLRFRTFSKAYGLAGARVGYAMGHPEIIAAFGLVRDHFGISRVSQAGAAAALGDQAWLAQVQRRITASRGRIADIATQCGLTPLPSSANFVAVDCGRDGAFAAEVMRGLSDAGIFLRQPGVAPLDRCIRISCGGTGDMALLEKSLAPAIDAAVATTD